MVTTKIREKIIIDKYKTFIKQEKKALEDLKQDYKVKKNINDIESVKMKLENSKNKYALEFAKKYGLIIEQ